MGNTIKVKMMKRIVFLLTVWSSLFGQNIVFDVNWTPYVTYYINMVDINTGESTMPIFLAELRQEDSDYSNPIGVDIEFEIIIDSDVLGVNNETLIKVETIQPIQLTAPIQLSNMDLNLSTDALFDTDGNQVQLNLDITENMDLSNADELMSVIMQTGYLPNGVYTFRVIVTSESGQQIIEEDILNISNPSLLQLISPGGLLSDTLSNEVYTSYPVFQWESDPCNYVNPVTDENGCQYFIRVSEFKSEEHSSVDQAIESLTRLPLDQTLGFAPVGVGLTTFQYPTDAGDLEPGNVYVWQIRKDIVTTSGTEQMLSDIMAFKIKDFTSSDEEGNDVDETSPLIILLRSIIGDPLADRIFGQGGQGYGMVLNGNITLNEESIEESYVQSMINTGILTQDEEGNETYRPMEVISVEVIE